MTFCRKIDNNIRMFPFKNIINCSSITNIILIKNKILIIYNNKIVFQQAKVVKQSKIENSERNIPSAVFLLI